MTNLQRLADKYNLLIFISMIVKNYKHIFLTASELRQNCGIKLIIFQINLIKNSSIALNLELLNVRIYKERKKEAWGRKCNNIMKNKLSILKKYEKNILFTKLLYFQLPASNFISLKIN
jgi:hypothetical protein